MFNSPLGNILGKPPGYHPSEAMGTPADFLDKFPGMARIASRLDSRSFLDSRSSSPADSETSGFSSGSDRVCDLLVWIFSHVFLNGFPLGIFVLGLAMLGGCHTKLASPIKKKSKV